MRRRLLLMLSCGAHATEQEALLDVVNESDGAVRPLDVGISRQRERLESDAPRSKHSMYFDGPQALVAKEPKWHTGAAAPGQEECVHDAEISNQTMCYRGIAGEKRAIWSPDGGPPGWCVCRASVCALQATIILANAATGANWKVQ